MTPSDRWDWSALKAKVATSGLRNSLLVAPMPTASTAQVRSRIHLYMTYHITSYYITSLTTHIVAFQILGNNESTEPFTSNMYNRRVLAGEFPVSRMRRIILHILF